MDQLVSTRGYFGEEVPWREHECRKNVDIAISRPVFMVGTACAPAVKAGGRRGVCWPEIDGMARALPEVRRAALPRRFRLPGDP